MSRSTFRLSEAARELVIPEGIVSTGWPRIKDRLATMAITFDPWQEAAAKITLGKRADGLYAATVGGVVWSLCRQVGKTFTVGSLLVAMCLEFPGLRVAWTSHHLRTTTNTFRAMQAIVRRPEILPLLAHTARSDGIRTANGEQEIRFDNGSILMFGAREFGFGRGIDAIDIMVFDEAQNLGAKALEDMVATTMQAKHPHGALLLYLGTPPRPIDDGEVFELKRQRSIDGKTADTFYMEFGADPDADPDDRAQWRKANPSFPSRTPLEAMLRLRENLPSDEAWLREGLGIWRIASGATRVIPTMTWNDASDPQSEPLTRLVLGIEVAPDQTHASIALAGMRADETWHVELADSREGVDWVVPTIEKVMADAPPGTFEGVVADAGSPTAALFPQFEKAGIRLSKPTVQQLGIACTAYLSGLVTGTVWHTGQPQVTAAAAVVGKRPLGNTGMWTWSRKSTHSDITPILAQTLALWGAQSLGEPSGLGSDVARRTSPIKSPTRRRKRRVTVLS